MFEAKGLEFSHVLCFDLLSDNYEEWEDIFNNRAKRSSKYRFLFNLYYVAVSRTREYICFMEKNKYTQKFVFSDRAEIFNVQDVTADAIQLDNDVIPEEWYNDAANYERAEQFERAISSYRKYAMVMGDKDCVLNDIYRCEAKRHLEQKEFNKAGEKFLLISDFSKAEEAFREAKNTLKVFESSLRTKPEKHLGKSAAEICEYILEGWNDNGFIEAVINYYFFPKIESYEVDCLLILEEMDKINGILSEA